jgi:hypothetical protein
VLVGIDRGPVHAAATDTTRASTDRCMHRG